MFQQEPPNSLCDRSGLPVSVAKQWSSLLLTFERETLGYIQYFFSDEVYSHIFHQSGKYIQGKDSGFCLTMKNYSLVG